MKFMQTLEAKKKNLAKENLLIWKKLINIVTSGRLRSKWPYTTIWENMYKSTIICKIFRKLLLFWNSICENRVFHDIRVLWKKFEFFWWLGVHGTRVLWTRVTSKYFKNFHDTRVLWTRVSWKTLFSRNRVSKKW